MKIKKLYVFATIAAILISICCVLPVTNVEAKTEYTVEAEFSDVLALSDKLGLDGAANAGHGGHQTRVVHTSHGDYAAYLTDIIEGENGKEIDEFSIVKVDSNGEASILFKEYKAYDSSQVFIYADKDQNVWAVLIYGERLKDQFDGRTEALSMAAYRVDAKTDDVEGYRTIMSMSAEVAGGYSYSSSCFDVVNNRIYTITSSGDYPKGYLTWCIFDAVTCEWDGVARRIQTDSRQCYSYMYADGKGGLIVVNNRDVKCTSLGYPEIGSNNGLSNSDLANIPGGRWSANYCWDQLDLYYIPNVYEEKAEHKVVAEADYSRVKGETQDERNSFDFREKNEYPNFACNQGGDVFIDKDGYLHLIWVKRYSLAAFNRNVVDSKWFHDVYDIKNPANIKLLSSTQICDEIAEAKDARGKVSCSFRMYQDTKGNIYFVSGRAVEKKKSTMRLLAVKGSVNKGYEYEEVASVEYDGDHVLNISNNRSASYADDRVAIIFNSAAGNNKYSYATLTIGYKEVKPSPTPTVIETEIPYEPGEKVPPREFNPLPLWIVAGVLVAGLVAIAVVGIVKKNKKDEK